ncbi:MAG TPA: serine protease [Caulobacteraceae bacterium]|jgi:S1-C subfamily serine protease
MVYPYKVDVAVPNFAFALGKAGADAVEQSLPHLHSDFPQFENFNYSVGMDDDVVLITIEFKVGGIPTGGTMKPDEFNQLKALAGERRTFAALKSVEALQSKFGCNKFMLVLDAQNEEIDWHIAQRELINWLNDEPLARANKLNAARVEAAVPRPPQYSLGRVQSAMWVLECEDTFVQGTAFDLTDFGVVTNEHVVRGVIAMKAFRADKPTVKHPIKILTLNPALDLAIIQIDGGHSPAPLVADESDMPPMSHIAVCGFPNFRLGDSGVLTPGFVIGTRPHSGVRRLMTNAPIIAGMSGGPVLGPKGGVVGVCVTGAGNYGDASSTEDHSVIPISALHILCPRATS